MTKDKKMSEYFNRESITAQQGFHPLLSIKPKEPIPGGMRFYTENGLLDIYFYAPGVIRFHFLADEVFDYGLLVSEPQKVISEIQTHDSGLTLSSEGIECHIRFSPFTIQLKRGDQLLIESINDYSMEGSPRFYPFAVSEEPAWQVSLALNSGEPVYGLGEKFGRLNHRGELITSWNWDALGVNAERSYKNLPFAWSPEGWGIFVNTPSRVKHAVGYSPWSHRSYILQVEDGSLDFFLFAQPSPAAIIDLLSIVTPAKILHPHPIHTSLFIFLRNYSSKKS